MSNDTATQPFSHPLINYELPETVEKILSAAPSVTVPETLDDIRALAVRDEDERGWHEVPGREKSWRPKSAA